MLQLALLLLGGEAIRRHWLALGVIGLGWALLGVTILTQAVEHIHYFTMHLLGFLLVIEGAATFVVRLAGHRLRLWQPKVVVLLVAGLAIIDTPLRHLMIISILFGLALAADSVVRTASVLLVRFQGWRVALVGTSIEFVLAVLALTPWPVSYEATIPFCIGVALILSGWTVLRSAILLRRLDPGAPVTSLPIFEHERGWHASRLLPALLSGAAGEHRMIVHVWTPMASAAHPLHRPVFDRYIAAIDRQGTVSTGHAALELPPDLYISHYSAADLDFTPDEFRRALHAGHRNDVAGRFLPDHAYEVASWCESTVQVAFTRFSAERLRAFWAAYRQDNTYNLTNRNCSVAVALALDAALEGVLARRAVWPPLLRLLVNPELYFATLLRKRARTMTWTPGLVLDYARALERVVDPAPRPWRELAAGTLRRWRAHRRATTAGAVSPVVSSEGTGTR